jgi:hypothetical protein
MKSTLIIHPEDYTTDMLKLIYEHRDFTVVNDGNITEEELRTMIEEHDRIIMLGHGTPSGLLNPQRGGYLVDSRYADLLKQKETISVWCHSDQFFRKHGMKGFHTGMIISEVYEAQAMLGETPLDEEETLDNMIKFSQIIADCLDMTPTQMKDYVLDNYVGDDKVTLYNRKNIIVL